MNFLLEHVGRKIIIHNTEGADWITKGNEYVISRVINRNTVALKNILHNWASRKDGSWSLVMNTEIIDFKEGDEVLLAKDTTSLKKGCKVIIKGLIDDDKSKVVIKGLIPGGWVSSNSLVKIIKLEEHRIKKAIELLSEFGPNFVQNFSLDHSNIDVLGSKLSELSIVQDGYELFLKRESGDLYLYPELYTNKKYEPLEIYIKSEGDIKLVNSGYVGPEIAQIANKNYREVKKGFDPENEKSVITFCNDYCKRGYCKIGQVTLSMETLKIIKKETNETIQVTPLLPF